MEPGIMLYIGCKVDVFEQIKILKEIGVRRTFINGKHPEIDKVLCAIQDAGIGELVGTTSFGKGIVQNLYPLGDGSAIKITVAGYYTRGGRNINKSGIEPDYTVELDKEKFENENVDTQLEKAAELLLEKQGKKSN